ncbi:MAG: mobile mystery protein B [Burkholderiales bacterium]|nr:mobile mystery protein B [Burkholderiales bacterium]
MALNFITRDAPNVQDGQTPLDPNEKAGLIPAFIETKGALNDWEQENILQAIKWLQRVKAPVVLSEGFCRDLHRRMFNKTWKWAGTFRQSDKNIGCDWTLVAVKLNQLLNNAQYWVENDSFPPDELAARFHHALVWIHPFPNGNGRHSRMMADALLKQMGQKAFSWGAGANLISANEVRARYLNALRAADKNDFTALLAFVRS